MDLHVGMELLVGAEYFLTNLACLVGRSCHLKSLYTARVYGRRYQLKWLRLGFNMRIGYLLAVVVSRITIVVFM